MALRLPPPQRTQGDGMEKTESESPIEHEIVLYPKELKEVDQGEPGMSENKQRIKKFSSENLQPFIVKLIPHTVKKKNERSIQLNLKNKEPKFVPYEPYKAAVKPIVPNNKKTSSKAVKKDAKKIPAVFENKNIDEFKTVLEKKEDKTGESSDIDWKLKAMSLESQVKTLQEENEQIENQLKFQVQVNGELKNLLVAAVGEDMEVKVHVLTEDKLHLARALLNSAKSLSTHQEQTEWLAGQCEVWRSKFLASSVMVEELARWKASLSHKVNEAHDIVKKLLEDRNQIRESLLRTHLNLSHLRDNFDLHHKRNNLPSTNILDLSAENLKLTQVLLIQLLGSDSETSTSVGAHGLPELTPAERLAEHMLANPHLLHLIGEPDAACNAVVGAAVALSGQLYLQSHPPRIECCPQCSGEIKLL